MWKEELTVWLDGCLIGWLVGWFSWLVDVVG